MEHEDGSTAERAEDIEKNPAGVVRRWLLEIKLADKREDDWRKEAKKVWDRYRQKESKKYSFNILWSNTETLRPAVYNSVPKPDVRRRFKDQDPLGKAVSEVLGRSLEYSIDTTSFDTTLKACVLDMLLPGRAVARVRYLPSLEQVGVTAEEHEEEDEIHKEGEEAQEGYSEELAWEQVAIEQVQWDDYRQSSGKTWQEVCWVGFRHRLTREELEEKFGEVGSLVNLDSTDDDDVERERDERIKESFKTAEVWEIWDKEEKEVLFIAPGYKDKPLQVIDDPLNLVEFFPIPRPLYAIEDSASTLPVPLYLLYKEQAEELDRISERINVIVKGLKYRGVYDSTLPELAELMRGQDNDLIPAAGVTALLERGGLEKAIWFMPIDMAAKVLQILYQQRDAAKQVIYEITGIADIIRGASNASETATAQQIKDKWGSMRLKRMQEEVSRFARDLIRLMSEIIGERFQPETFAQMTGLKFPTETEKKQVMLQYQQQAVMAQSQGQQPPPPPNLPPSWDEIIGVMRDDKQRTFKVDVETDSTIAASVQDDMQGMQQVAQAMGVILKEFMPIAQGGVMPIEAVKELMLSISRRARFGNAFEDAIDKMKQPEPQPQQQDNSLQIEQMRAQVKAQADQAALQAEERMEQQRMQFEATMEQQRMEHERSLEAARLQSEGMLKIILAKIEEQKAIEVAQVNSQATIDSAQMSAASQASQDTPGE